MLKAVRHSRLEVHATILVVSRAVLLERLTQYATVAQIPGEPGRRYPRQEWWQAFQSLDLGDLYRKWIEFLEMNHISYRLVDSSNDHYQPIARDELGDVLANHTAARRDDFTG